MSRLLVAHEMLNSIGIGTNGRDCSFQGFGGHPEFLGKVNQRNVSRTGVSHCQGTRAGVCRMSFGPKAYLSREIRRLSQSLKDRLLDKA